VIHPGVGRKYLRLRARTRQLLKNRIRQGGYIFHWLDNWHPNGPLLPKYSFRVVYDTGSSINFQVSSVPSDALVEIQAKVMQVS
jgi:hypothetical protein